MLQTHLLHWFKKNQRALPWRRHYVPYEVWISEIMLQQTQMDTVLPYYKRWMKEFPDIHALAKSPVERVLKAWEGLGYYSRARRLHENARYIVQKYQGVFPSDYEKILSLKGIGRYTAGAISSIAFNQNKPIVDGNVLRVLSRLYAIQKPIDVEKNKEIFWKKQASMIPQGKAREFNQALMELGALICSSQNPSCPLCPIRKYCKAYSDNNPDMYPVKKFKKKNIRIQAAALVLKRDDRYWIHFRPVGKIMGGLWEFPEWKLSQNKEMNKTKLTRLTQKEVFKELGIKLKTLKTLGVIKRNYTRYLESLHVFYASVSKESAPKLNRGWRSVWVKKENFSQYAFSAAHLKITRLL